MMVLSSSVLVAPYSFGQGLHMCRLPIQNLPQGTCSWEGWDGLAPIQTSPGHKCDPIGRDQRSGQSKQQFAGRIQWLTSSVIYKKMKNMENQRHGFFPEHPQLGDSWAISPKHVRFERHEGLFPGYLSGCGHCQVVLQTEPPVSKTNQIRHLLFLCSKFVRVY